MRIGVFLEELTQSLSFLPRVMIAFYFLYNKFRSIFVRICSMGEPNHLFFVKLPCKLFKPRRYQHIRNRHSWLVHYRPGSNKLTNEKSYARLTDRKRSVLAGDRAMYPPLRGDGVARKEIQREIVSGDGDRCWLMYGFEGERLMKLSVLVV